MKLYDHPESFNSLRARAAAFEAGRDIEICTVDLFAGAHRQPAFRALNPFERVPVLEDGDFRLTESCAIAVHLARETPLVPSDAYTRAHLDQWQFFGSIHVTGAMTKVFRQRVVHRAMGAPVDEAVVATGLAELDEVLPVLDGALARRD
jgi:glutathione S-transferase